VNPREVISHDSLLLARGSDDSEASCLPGRLLAAMPVAAFNGLGKLTCCAMYSITIASR